MSDRPPFPAVLDSTIVAAFRSCPQKMFREFVQHYKPATPSVHLHAGGAFAKGLEIARKSFFQDGLSAEESEARGLGALMKEYGEFQCPADSAKSLERTAGAFEYYFSQYPLQTEHAKPAMLPSGRIGIEFSFAEPLPINNPETGDPILYCGRMDQIVEYSGALYGEDDKTTSQLGSSWARQWDLRSQFTGYCWAARQAGIPLNGFLVRGISILKTKYETLQAITYRHPWMIDRWYEQLLRDVARIIQCWESGVWDFNLDHACAEYGGCPFRQVCLSSDPEPWLQGGFIRRRWNPLSREEEEVV